VADEPSSTPGPFDVRTIRFLVALMSRHDLSEIDLSQGDQRIRLRRGQRVAALPAAAVPAPTATPALPAPAPVPAPTPAAQEKPPARPLHEIKSIGVGTFYDREKPESPPYVTVGSRVTPSTVVGLHEAMKIFNEITADCSGVVVEVLVKNQQAIEYGQVLFKVDPNG
jgi:acetyl-CoA carboxylase biotin carboxyl carrier protein